MGLETATYISQLNAAWPIGAADPKSQGDDHLRLLKSTIQASFPNITGAMTMTHTQLNNAAIKNESNTFTLQQLLSSAQPRLTWNETDGAANNRRWDLQAQGEQFKLLVLSDDELSSSAPVIIDRTGTVTDSVAFSTPLMTLDGALSLSKAFVGSAITGYPLVLTSGTPIIALNETDAAANNRLWDFGVSAEQLVGRVVNDAVNAAVNWLTVDRTANAVDSVVLAGSLVQFTTATANLTAAGTTTLRVTDSSAPANEKIWGLTSSAGVFGLQTFTDAGAATVNAILVDRTGTGVDVVEFNTPLLRAVGIHNGTATGGPSAPALASGTYTPTYTNGTNVDATSHVAAQWLRVGNVVTVSGVVAVDATIINNPTVIGISLPVASNLTSVGDCAGTLSQGTNNANGHGQITGDTANDRATGNFTCNIATSFNVAYQFTYVVK